MAVSLLADSASTLRGHPALQNRDLLMAGGKSDCDLGEEQADQTLWSAQFAKHAAG